MKTPAELISQPPVFAGEFIDQDAVFDAFGLTRTQSKGITVLYAWYKKEGNKGAAFVLYEKAGELFEVWADHGKNFGLEGQWEPETCDLDRILYEAEKAKKKKYNKDKPPKLPDFYFFLTGEDFNNGE